VTTGGAMATGFSGVALVVSAAVTGSGMVGAAG